MCFFVYASCLVFFWEPPDACYEAVLMRGNMIGRIWQLSALVVFLFFVRIAACRRGSE